MVRIDVETLFRMGRSYNDNDYEIPQTMVDSSKGMDDKTSSMEKGSLQY
jgi:hypothetical protein